MGFKNLYLHNLALLAKQGWRLIQKPNSLVARLYKAKYHPNGTFWDAEVPRNASQSWRGLLEGRKLLEKGIIWRISDGSGVKVHSDPWIPRVGNHKPNFCSLNDQARVSDLMVSPSYWNEALVRQSFSVIDVDAILTIPLGLRKEKDLLGWYPDRKGRFSTSSADKLALQETVNREGLASSSSIAPYWPILWKLPLQAKVKVHIWKVCCDILPVTLLLRSKRVQVSPWCSFCGEGEESVLHVVKECTCVKTVVAAIPELRSFFEINTHSTISSWIGECLRTMIKTQASWFCYFLWSVWKERNRRVWSGKCMEAPRLVQNATHGFQEYRTLCPLKTKPPSRTKARWRAPPIGWLKMNVDGAWKDGIGGIGYLWRNHEGVISGGGCVYQGNVKDPLTTEALALRAACLAVQDGTLTPIIVETDCLQLINALPLAADDTSHIGSILRDIADITRQCPSIRFKHVYREANEAAHTLSKVGTIPSSNVMWNREAHLLIKETLSKYVFE